MEEHNLDTEAQEVAASNWQQVLRDGPGLRCTTGVFIIAKDTKRSKVLLGGLGGMGVGQDWRHLTERHEGIPGFDSAPDIDTLTQNAYLDYWDGKVKVGDGCAWSLSGIV